MIRRAVSTLIHQRLARFPAVALIGPRQCGKTTLARSLSRRYFDLEQPSEGLRLDLGWNDLTAQSALIVLDEAQTWPELFPRLRSAIDTRRKKNGRFLLLGSLPCSRRRRMTLDTIQPVIPNREPSEASPRTDRS